MPDPARKAVRVYEIIKHFQDSMSSLEEIKVPVLAGVHSLCVGGGINLTSAADIQVCTEDAKFTVKEVDIAIAADIGAL